MVAALYVHQAEPRHWRDDEVALVQEVAERTWTSVLRARAETALRESEARFRQFAEHSTDMLWILDAETLQMEYVSPAFERVWSRPVGAIPKPQSMDRNHSPGGSGASVPGHRERSAGRDGRQGVPHRPAGREHAPHPCDRVPDPR